MNFRTVTPGKGQLVNLQRGNVVKVKGLRGFKDVPMQVVKRDGGNVYVRPFEAPIKSRPLMAKQGRAIAAQNDHRSAKRVSIHDVVAVAVR